jgi:hypothetical protein
MRVSQPYSAAVGIWRGRVHLRHREVVSWVLVAVAAVVILLAGQSSEAAEQEFRRLPLSEYRDKMVAGWIGQLVGVGIGGPTEFGWNGAIVPADEVPEWRPAMVNQFEQDDLYVEMTFLRALEMYGLDVSIRQAGIDFANSGYGLWHANGAGRGLLRQGVAPPDSGHPEFNKHADDIDYQIEADFSGLIAPGLPNTVITLGETFGRLMNYGDGLYGGQFVGAMYAEAFFETNMARIVEAGLRAIPADSQYAECIRDVLAWWREEPNDWEKTWEKINAKYHLDPDYRRFSCSGNEPDFNIDAKVNGAMIVLGLLYGNGDPDKTIEVSLRGGHDSDCNPSNAAGVLFTTMGASRLPEHFTSELSYETEFSHTPYNMRRLTEVCGQLARQAVARAGGRVETDESGEDVLVIPLLAPQSTALERCWEPRPAANSRFTEAEMAQISWESPVLIPTGPVCQSCGLKELDAPGNFGSNADGSKSEDYCVYCFKDGVFTYPDATLEEMIEFCASVAAEHVGISDAEALSQLSEHISKLKRWQEK